VFTITPFEHVRKQNGAKEGARGNGGTAECTYYDAHDYGEDGEPTPEFAEPLVENIYSIEAEAGMEYQLSHEDEEWYGEKSEGCNRGENPGHNPYKTRHTTQKEIGSNHIDDEEGKGYWNPC